MWRNEFPSISWRALLLNVCATPNSPLCSRVPSRGKVYTRLHVECVHRVIEDKVKHSSQAQVPILQGLWLRARRRSKPTVFWLLAQVLDMKEFAGAVMESATAQQAD